MDILIIAHNLLPPFNDVIEQYLQTMPSEVKRIHLIVLSDHIPDEFLKKYFYIHIYALQLKHTQLKGVKLKLIWRLFQITKKIEFSWIMTHRYKPFYCALMLQFLKPTKNILGVFHEFNCFRSRTRQFFLKLFKLFFPQKNLFFAGVSQAITQDLKKAIPFFQSSAFLTLYNCIQIQNLNILDKTSARHALNINTQDFVFGNIARLVPNKNHQTLLKAFAIAKKNLPHAKLVIIGAGKEHENLKMLANELNMTDSIIWCGQLNAAAQYLKAFDVFVLTSTQEAFGRVLLEAMLARVPIIASQTGGIPEVLGTESICLSPQDAYAFANAMISLPLRTQTEINDMTEKQYQRLIHHFSYESFAQNLKELFLTRL